MICTQGSHFLSIIWRRISLSQTCIIVVHQTSLAWTRNFVFYFSTINKLFQKCSFTTKTKKRWVKTLFYNKEKEYGEACLCRDVTKLRRHDFIVEMIQWCSTYLPHWMALTAKIEWNAGEKKKDKRKKRLSKKEKGTKTNKRLMDKVIENESK